MKTRQHAFLLIGSIGPLGYMPASGTVTVGAIGIPLFWLMHELTPGLYLAITVAFAALSVWLHAVGDRLLGEKDSRKLVWDELVGFMVAVTFVKHFTWQVVLLAFLFERTLDIFKFPPANLVEKHWPGGWGVVGDDVVAGLYTCGIVHTCLYLAPSWMGVTP